MSYRQEHLDFVIFLKDNYTGLKLQWTNLAHTELDRPFIKARIRNVDASDFTMRNGGIDYPGFLSLNLIGVEGAGVLDLFEEADTLIALLDDVSVSDKVRTGHAYKEDLGPEGGNYTIVVTVPFTRRETK